MPSLETTTPRKWRLAGTAGLLVLVLVAAIPLRESQLKSQLREQLVTAFRNRDVVALEQAAPWRELGVFGPYSSDEVISEAMGIESRFSVSSGLEYSDSICLMIVVMDSGHVEHFVVPRRPFDLCSVNGGRLPLVLKSSELREDSTL